MGKGRSWQSRKEYNKHRYRQLRLSLIEHLGGKCKDCPENAPDKLQFDHKYERTWVASKVSQWVRIARYWREARAKLIELRCKPCNQKKGKPAAFTGVCGFCGGPASPESPCECQEN